MFFGRFTAMLRAYAAVLAGVNKLDVRRFFAFNALGGIAWASIMGFGAYLCGRSIENVMGPVGLGLLAFVLMGAVALWLFMRRHEARLMVAAEAAIPGPLAEGPDGTAPQAAPLARDDDAARRDRIQADFADQVEALLSQREAGRNETGLDAIVPPRRRAVPLWFKIPALVVASAVVMTLVSWHDGVTGGFYGRLVGHVGILGAALILVVPVVLLIVIGWRLDGSGRRARHRRGARRRIGLRERARASGPSSTVGQGRHTGPAMREAPAKRLGGTWSALAGRPDVPPSGVGS